MLDKIFTNDLTHILDVLEHKENNLINKQNLKSINRKHLNDYFYLISVLDIITNCEMKCLQIELLEDYKLIIKGLKIELSMAQSLN